MENNELTRTQIHEKAMICIFQYLFYQEAKLTERKAIEDIISEVMETPFDDCDLFFRAIIFETIKNRKEYIDLIESKLINWKFERLCLTDQAILLLFTSEIKNNRVPSQVAIDMGVDLSHRYCDEKSYRKINKVLDRIANEND